MDRAAKDDLIPLLYAPSRRASGFVEMARSIGDSPPHLATRERVGGGTGPSGAVATIHSSTRAIRKSRIAHRQFTGPPFRTLLADMGGSISRFFRRQIAGRAASWKSRKQYRPDYGPKRGSPPGPDGPWFQKSGRSNSGKATGVIRGIPVPGGPRRSLGPETPAPTRGEAGMASSLVSTWGWGPPERRRRAEIPDLIATNPRGGLPKSGAADFAGNSPGRRLPHPTSRGIPRGGPEALEILRGIPRGLGNFPANSPMNAFPGDSPVGYPGDLAAASNYPGNCTGNCPWNSPGDCTPRPGPREIPREVQQPEIPRGIHRYIFRGIRERQPGCDVFRHSGRGVCRLALADYLGDSVVVWEGFLPLSPVRLSYPTYN